MRTITDHIVEGDARNHQVAITVLDQPGPGNASHLYAIDTDPAVAQFGRPNTPIGVTHGPGSSLIQFQNGPIKEVGVNGVTDQSLAALLIDRLRGFQAGQYACENNAEALAHLEAYMECSKRRTLARISRGVEGTHQK